MNCWAELQRPDDSGDVRCVTTSQQPPTGRQSRQQIPQQWGPPPLGWPPSSPPPPGQRRASRLGGYVFAAGLLAALVAVTGSPIGFVLGIASAGLAIAGLIRRARLALTIIGLILGLAAIVLSTVVSIGLGGAAPAPGPVPSTATVEPAPVTPAAVPAPAPPPAPAKAITAREWLKLAKDPGAHVGESIIVYGHVTQFDSATGTDSFRASVDGVRHQQSYEYQTNTFLTGDATVLADVVADDMFKAEVVVGNPYTYTTTMGGQTTVPTLMVTKITTAK